MLTQKEYFEAINEIEQIQQEEYSFDRFIYMNKIIDLVREYEQEHYKNGIPPNVLANALQDPIHKNLPKAKAAKSIKTRK